MNRRKLTVALTSMAIGAAAVSLSGCASNQVTNYAAEKPVLELSRYLNGTLDAHGVFTDRSGAVGKRFTVLMVGSWQGDTGTLDEDFTYSDGSRQKRIWHLRKTGPGVYEGRADDVVGVAHGRSSGNAFHWTYTMALPMDGRVIEVQFDDWMYLVDERVMLNKARMSKFGITLGEVTLSFGKR